MAYLPGELMQADITMVTSNRTNFVGSCYLADTPVIVVALLNNDSMCYVVGPAAIGWAINVELSPINGDEK